MIVGKHLFTRDDAFHSLTIVRPAIIALLETAMPGGNNLAKRPHLYMVMLDPSATWVEGALAQDAILCDHVLQLNNEQFEHDYRAIGIGKAAVSWRTGLPTGQMLAGHPGLFREGDMKYRGSWVTESGLVIASSGIQSHLDEAASKMWGAVAEGILYEKLQKRLADPSSDII